MLNRYRTLNCQRNVPGGNGPQIKGLNALVGKSKDAALDDAAHLLLDQARIAAGEPVPAPAAFSRRLTAAMESGPKGKGERPHCRALGATAGKTDVGP